MNAEFSSNFDGKPKPIYLPDENGNWTVQPCKFCGKHACISHSVMKRDGTCETLGFTCNSPECLRKTLPDMPPPASTAEISARTRSLGFAITKMLQLDKAFSPALVDEFMSITSRMISEARAAQSESFQKAMEETQTATECRIRAAENKVFQKATACPECQCPIDPEVCWCGDYMEGHSGEGSHAPTPMGCNCGRAKAQ